MRTMPISAPISVVIPAFNAENTLAACISSILRQTLPPSEIIVVDDGSRDHTAAVAEKFSPAVKLLKQPNLGSAVARQRGTEAARSNHIAYLDADDWWPEHTIETYTRFLMEDEEIHFVIADFVRAEKGTTPTPHSPTNSSFYPWFSKFVREHGVPTEFDGLFRLPSTKGLDAMLRGFPYYPSASMARRESVLGVGGWDERFRRCQDFDLALRLTKRYPLHFFDSVQAIVGLNEGNRNVRRYVIQQTRGDIRVLRAHHESSRHDSTYRRQVKHALARKYYSLGNTYRETGDMRSARGAYWSALGWPGRRTKSLARMLLPGL